MTSYQPESWHDLFVASAGAAAALTGLIFVAVSINLAKIVDPAGGDPPLGQPPRADGGRG